MSTNKDKGSIEIDNTEDRDQLEEKNTELKKVEKILTRLLERINLSHFFSKIFPG